MSLFTVLALVITQLSTAGRGFVLVTPKTHVMLTGDMDVKIMSSSSVKQLEYYPISSLVVQLVSADSQPTVMASAPVEGTSFPSQAVFKCGEVDVAGRYCFQLVQILNGTYHTLAESDILHLEWPHLHLEIPSSMETYSANFTARLNVQGVVCYPPKPHIRTWLELSYLGASMANGPVSTRFIQDVPEFYRVISRDYSIPCNTLDRPGYYQVLIRSDKGLPQTLTVSNGLKVTWSDAYDLSSPAASVFPCPFAGFTLFYSHPKCILDRDKIRVFGRPRSTVNAAGAAPPPLFYVGEKLVSSGGGKVDFPCHFFSPRFVAFCFEYVSTARSGAVANMKRTCIPAYLMPDVAYNGEWGSWSEWTSCSRSCGKNATKNRHRFCDSPPATQGGVFCIGSAIKVKKCELPPCPVIPTTKSPVEVAPVSNRCRCGCKMNISGGAYVAASRHLCADAGVWLLKVQQGHRLHLTFDYLHLGGEDEWVSARDGEFLSSQMLLSVTNTHNSSSSPVKSSSNAVLLEFHPSNRSNSSTGFVLHVQEITDAGVVLSQNFISMESSSNVVFKSTVHWVSLSFCILALVSTLMLAIIYLARRSRWTETRASSVVSVRSGYHPFPSLTTMTSVSEISLVKQVRRRKKKKRKLQRNSQCRSLSPVSSDDSDNRLTMLTSTGSLGSPEDYIKDATSIFVPTPEESPPLKSPPLARRPRQVALTPHKTKKLPVATVTPQRHPESRVKDGGEEPKKDDGKSVSASEVSLAPTEPEFEMEFDYYDYDVHDVPGSFFSVDPSVLSWLPPFLPQLWSDELVMADLNNLAVGESERRNEGGNGASDKEVVGEVETEMCSPVMDLNSIEFADASDSESPKRNVKR